MMPAMSSRSHMAYLVFTWPGRGFFVCENLIEAIIPPRMHSVRFPSAAASTVLCEQNVTNFYWYSASGWLER